MNEIWAYTLFELGDKSFTIGQFVFAMLVLLVALVIYLTFLKRYSPELISRYKLTSTDYAQARRLTAGLGLLFLVIILVINFGLDYVLFSNESFSLTILLIVRTLAFIQFCRLMIWIISNLFIHKYFVEREKGENSQQEIITNNEEAYALRSVKYLFITLILIYILRNFGIDFTIYERIINGSAVSFKFSNILSALLIIFSAQLFIWVITQIILHNVFNKSQVVVGSRYAINQLVKYIIYVFAIIMALDTFGINMNILLGGAAALLVGIGLGLQQTFNDFVSGIVILFERSVSVGDMLEVDGTIGRVKEIGLRSSILETRGNITMVIPNHKLVNEMVINWNHFNEMVRFDIDISVAYGSDTTLVKKLLLKSVENNPYVVKYPTSFIRFLNFADSSLEFKLFFFSRNYMVIEDIKSDIRLEIDRLFRENDINIPFPQAEIRIKKDG